MAEVVDIPKIVVVPLERSIHFNKRECTLSEPQKVGRSVDKRRILQNNLIFDCRVLSRNHALIWFENGKFYIRDTKSSNGTFVNETRLSPSGEESAPRELRSKDIVQFGVNVNVDKKAHGCIIARIRLFINDAELPGVEPPVQQVLQIIQNALSREIELETKLASMQDAVEGARQLATESMIAIVKEDELLSRLEMLENQLQVYAKNSSEDELKKQLAKAYEEKHQNDLTSKNSMRNILQEKLECVFKVTQLQKDYDKAEQECQRYKALCESTKVEHSQELAKLSEQLKNAEEEKRALQEKLNEEKETLAADLDHLKSDLKYKEEQLLKTKQRLEETEDELVSLKITIETDKQRLTTVQSPPLPQAVEETANQRVEVFVEQEAPPAISKESSPSSHKQLLRRDTLISSQILEPKHREWEMRVKGLEEELKESEKTVRDLHTQLTGYIKTEATQRQLTIQELARRMSTNAIAKGRLELLQSSLRVTEERVHSLQEQLALEASNRSVLERKLEMMQAQVEPKTMTHNSLTGSDKSALKREVEILREKYSKSLKDSVKTKTENTELVREVEDLRRQLDDSEKKANSTAGPLEKRVKLLTIIALVSIGVALASWLT